MSKNLNFLGIAGFIIFVFGLLTYFIISHDQFYFYQAHLLVGSLLLCSFVIRGGLQRFGRAAVKRAAGFGVGLLLYSLLFVGLLVLVNYFVSRHDPLHYDSTEQKVHTLAPQTMKVLAGLPEEVIVRGFFVGGEVPIEVGELFKLIARASDKVKWVVVDPEKRPELTTKYGISERDTLHFSLGGRGSTREAKIVRDISEQEVVNALLKLSRGGEKTIYWVSGHGESDLDEAKEAGFLFLKEAIHGESLNVKKLNLVGKDAVPEDASALLLMAPRRALLESERQVIRAYLESGGSALFLHEPNTTREIAELVKPLGIEVGDDIVLDQVMRLFQGPGVGVQPMVQSYGKHAAIGEFGEGTIFSTVSSVRKAEQLPEGSAVTELAFTSDKAWAEKKVDLVFSDKPTAALEDDDIRGPVAVASAFEGSVSNSVAKSGEKEAPLSRVVVIGDADFAANVNLRQLFNRDFFLNVLNWVVGEDEGVSIRPRTMRKSTKGLTEEQFRSIFLFTAILIPEIVILFGFLVWWRRKQ